MDSYNEYTTPPMRQRLEIALDVLKGCVYSCSGCTVDRELYATSDMVPVVSDIVDGFISDGFFPYDITVGATDFGSAVNVRDISMDQSISDLVRKFQTLAITCPMLDKTMTYYENLASNINELTRGECFIRIVMPIGPNYMNNITLMSSLMGRLSYLSDLLGGRLYEITFILNVTDEIIDKYSFEDILSIYNWPDIGIETDMVLNIPHGRLHDIVQNKSHSDSVSRVSRWIASFYRWMESDSIYKVDPDLDGFTGTHLNLGIIGESMYVVPYLKEEFNIFSNGFIIENKTYNGVMDTIYKMRKTKEQLIDCDVCDESPYCQEKGIHHIIKELGISQCPVK